MWINDFNWNNQIDAWDIELRKQNLQKQNPNQYLKVLENEVKQKLSDTSLSQWEKQILQKHLWVSTKAVQRNNVQRFQTKQETKQALWNQQKPKEWYNLKWARENLKPGDKRIARAEKEFRLLKLDVEYFNDDNFTSEKWWSWGRYWNDNWLTWGVNISAEVQTSHWNTYELKTHSELHTNNEKETTGEYHEVKLGKTSYSWNTRKVFGVVWSTTKPEFGHNAQTKIHELGDMVSREHYTKDKDTGNWVWIYAGIETNGQVIWNNNNWVKWIAWVEWQLMTEYWRTKIDSKVWLVWKTGYKRFYAKWTLLANAQYNFKDPKWKTIQSSVSWEKALWVDAEVALWMKVFGWNIEAYAAKNFWNKNRDPWVWIDFGNKYSPEDALSIWLRWSTNF